MSRASRTGWDFNPGVFILIIGLLILSGCQTIQNAVDFAGLLAGPAADADSQSLGIVLFQDDFSDLKSGWTRVQDEAGFADYENGNYKFLVRDLNWYYWATPNLSFTDVRIETKASQITANGTHLYGVICRYQDPENFYFFTVTSDGFYAISKFIDGQETLLGMDTMELSEAILQGAATNHLGVECVEDRLSFYANGTHLGSAQDGSFPSGDVGLIVSTFTADEAEFEYDYFSVLSP